MTFYVFLLSGGEIIGKKLEKLKKRFRAHEKNARNLQSHLFYRMKIK